MHTASLVVDEPAWRALPPGVAIASPAPRVAATRWHAATGPAREFDSATAGDRHVVKIVLRTMNIRLVAAGRTVRDGLITPGTFHVTEPGDPVRCLFRGPYDVLHLHVPNSLVDECSRAATDRPPATLGSLAGPARDPTVERLGRALLEADLLGGEFGRLLYADCISIAIVARLLAAAHRAAPRPRVTELAKWRLRRAVDYVEANLGQPVSLAELAASAGLTRMHFAAQFRAATGLRPHEYLLRRRVERAQELLAGSGKPVLEVAMSVGFQTQAHFSAIFRRFAGQPPRAWRRMHGLSMNQAERQSA